MKYPQVAGEFHTMEMVSKGYSLARFGDGELKMCQGYGYCREPGSPELASELTGVLVNSNARCLVGIPTYDKSGPKYQNWLRHKERFESVLAHGKPYYSAFVSRPDSAPWIDCAEYGELVESVWLDKKAAVICEPDGSMIKTVRLRAAQAKHIKCPRHRAYAQISNLFDRVMDYGPDVVIMSAGPTATCLADRFARVSVHAVDMGSSGGFLGRLLRK